jgi:hypothetical protein
VNRRERRAAARNPEQAQIIATYAKARIEVGLDYIGMAWGSMVYACADQPTPSRPVPPDWDRFVANAPEGFWDKRGGVPEIVMGADMATGEAIEVFPGKPGGCGYRETRYLCVGVEQPRRNPDVMALYPYTWVPSPLVAGSCPKCGLPMSHVEWRNDEEWWPPKAIPEGAPHFRLPSLEKAHEFAAEGYGGAEFVPQSIEEV